MTHYYQLTLTSIIPAEDLLNAKSQFLLNLFKSKPIRIELAEKRKDTNLYYMEIDIEYPEQEILELGAILFSIFLYHSLEKAAKLGSAQGSAIFFSSLKFELQP